MPKKPAISVNRDTYEAVKTVAHARNLSVGKFVDKLITNKLDAEARKPKFK